MGGSKLAKRRTRRLAVLRHLPGHDRRADLHSTYNGNEYAANRNIIGIYGTVPMQKTCRHFTDDISLNGAFADGTPDEVAVPKLICDPRKGLKHRPVLQPSLLCRTGSSYERHLPSALHSRPGLYQRLDGPLQGLRPWAKSRKPGDSRRGLQPLQPSLERVHRRRYRICTLAMKRSLAVRDKLSGGRNATQYAECGSRRQQDRTSRDPIGGEVLLLSLFTPASVRCWASRCDRIVSIMPKVLGLICVVLFALHLAPFARSQSYANGADVSYLAKCEQDGVVFKENGQPIDVLVLLREHHYNWVRLRIFHDPAAAPDKLPNDLPYTLALARRAKGLGFQHSARSALLRQLGRSRQADSRRRHGASSSTSSWSSRSLPTHATPSLPLPRRA